VMRVLVATDAWHPQVNGVVRTLTALAASARKQNVETSQRGSIPDWRGLSQGLAALRDFGSAFDRFGSFRVGSIRHTSWWHVRCTSNRFRIHILKGTGDLQTVRALLGQPPKFLLPGLKKAPLKKDPPLQGTRACPQLPDSQACDCMIHGGSA
jgi:hypothetical protein